MVTWSSILLVALISLAVGTMGHAEGGSPTYRLQVGDEIEITDRKVPDPQPVTIPVTPDGLLHLPFSRLDAVRAEGRTIEEVKRDIYEQFKKIYKRPDLVIVPKKIVGGNKIDVLGPVQKPGRHPYQPGMTVMDALSAAAGLREKAVPTLLYVIRSGQDVLSIDLRKLLAGDRSENKALQPDDVVIVKEQQGVVTVYGYVTKPGVYPWLDGMRAAQAIALSEGFKSDADLRSTVVLRQGSKLPVNFLLMQETGDTSQNVLLQPDDTVYVPRASRTVVVMGGVREPGSYEFQEDDRILSALRLARGFDESADRAGVIRVRRRDKELTVDLSKARRGENTDDNVPLEPNDIVIVPMRAEVTVVGEVKQPGTFLMSANTRLADALRRAQGVTRRADLKLVKIFRLGQVLEVDASRLEKGDLQVNLPLEPGDTVLVPESEGVSVFGAVGSPGNVPLPEDAHFASVLAAAHGWLPQIASDEATVLRTQSGKLIPLVVNLKKLQEGDPSQNALIKPGDVIIVPFRKETQSALQKAQNIFGLISTASYARFLLGQR